MGVMVMGAKHCLQVRSEGDGVGEAEKYYGGCVALHGGLRLCFSVVVAVLAAEDGDRYLDRCQDFFTKS